MNRPFKCTKGCGKDFAMEWARENHDKNCRGKIIK